MDKTISLLVSYYERGIEHPQDTVVDVPVTTIPSELPGLIKQRISPRLPGDRSDGFRGSFPRDISLLSICNLDAVLALGNEGEVL